MLNRSEFSQARGVDGQEPGSGMGERSPGEGCAVVSGTSMKVEVSYHFYLFNS